MSELASLIAQTTQPGGPPSQPGPASMLPLLLMMGAVFYFILIRPQSKERKRRTSMLDAVKKNDRVITIGGILGTVLSVKDDEITLKVDESSNTKITFTKSAIQRVISAGPAEATTTPAPK